MKRITEIVRDTVSAHSMLHDDMPLVWGKFMESLECGYISKAEINDNIIVISNRISELNCTKVIS